MLVYRIEHKDTKQGPFNFGSRIKVIKSRQYEEWRYDYIRPGSHPSPYDDSDIGFGMVGLYTNKLEPIFGTRTLQQAKHWLGDYWKVFHNYGYVIGVYNADDKWCLRGNFQVVFCRKKAKLVEVIRLRKLRRL